MKVSICSREAVEERIVRGDLSSSAVISFHDPVGRGRRARERYLPVDFLGRAERVFYVSVHDLDPEALADFGLTVDSYFTEADELAEFIYSAYASGLEIVCQCEYGQSRSAACAAAVLEHFEGSGISVFRDYRYYPNQLVFNKTLEALDRVRDKREGNG